MSRWLIFPAALLLIGCSSNPPPSDWARRPRTARVEWLGHHAFLVTTSLGTRLLLDPYSPGSVPHTFPKGIRPDVLLISNESRRSNNDAAVENIPITFRSSLAAAVNNAHGIRVRGTPLYPDPENPSPAGMNVVFSWTSDGLRFCFLGDAPVAPSAADAAAIGPVDILFLPVGGRMSSASQELAIARLQPRIVLPMGPPGAVSTWQSASLRSHRLESSWVLLNREALPPDPVALLFSPP